MVRDFNISSARRDVSRGSHEYVELMLSISSNDRFRLIYRTALNRLCKRIRCPHIPPALNLSTGTSATIFGKLLFQPSGSDGIEAFGRYNYREIRVGTGTGRWFTPQVLRAEMGKLATASGWANLLQKPQSAKLPSSRQSTRKGCRSSHNDVTILYKSLWSRSQNRLETIPSPACAYVSDHNISWLSRNAPRA